MVGCGAYASRHTTASGATPPKIEEADNVEELADHPAGP
jgi:hypothetical protein